MMTNIRVSQKRKKVVMMDGVQTGNILVGKKKHLLLLKISGYVRNINIMMMMVKVEGILKKLKMPEVLLTGLKNKNKSVPKSGTLGISECVVRRLKALQHIYFLEVCIWRESWCLLGVLSNNKPQNE